MNIEYYFPYNCRNAVKQFAAAEEPIKCVFTIQLRSDRTEQQNQRWCYSIFAEEWSVRGWPEKGEDIEELEGDGGWVERVNEKLSENGNFREANLYGGFV